MQKLERRNTYTPGNTSLVPGNCDCALNKIQSEPSVHSLKTLSNNSKENKLRKEKQNMRVSVYVLNMRGQPLMPTTPTKARHLLKQKKAKVVSRKPFTIQLNYATGETKQPIELGIDSGYGKVGFSATTDKKEVMSGEVTLRTDIPKLLLERRMYRREKRNKHHWYRPPRFDNRGQKDWLAPSIKHKLDSHIRLVEKIKKLLPITNVTVEVASFDIQKIKNPSINGEEYQQGEQTGFWNTREYVLHRDNHECQHPNCKHKKDIILCAHHINGKSEGATDRPEELITLHKTCHDEHHAGKNVLPKVKIKQFKPETFMTAIRWKLVNALGCKHTYGYITKSGRIELKLPKSHVNDAFVIAGGTTQERCEPFVIKQVRRNNRCLQINRKGFKPSIRRKHYGLQPYDRVTYASKEYQVKGVHSRGAYIIIADAIEKLDVSIKKVELVCYGKGLQFLPRLKPWVSLEM